ncbi:unnamed protein product, partial [marine sediment metagenome]
SQLIFQFGGIGGAVTGLLCYFFNNLVQVAFDTRHRCRCFDTVLDILAGPVFDARDNSFDGFVFTVQ